MLVGLSKRGAFEVRFDTKAEGVRWEIEERAKVFGSIRIDPAAGKVLFRTFYADWSKRQIWQGTTVSTMNSTVRSVTFGDVPIGAICKPHIEHWVKTMTVAGIAPGTAHSRNQHMRSVFRGPVDDRKIAIDPTNGVRLPAKRRAEAAMVIPTPHQVGALLETADDDFRVFVALCAVAGLRLGEAAGVQVADIDFARRTLRVQRQVQRRTGGGVEIRAPKYNSERTVYLADPCWTCWEI